MKTTVQFNTDQRWYVDIETADGVSVKLPVHTMEAGFAVVEIIAAATGAHTDDEVIDDYVTKYGGEALELLCEDAGLACDPDVQGDEIADLIRAQANAKP